MSDFGEYSKRELLGTELDCFEFWLRVVFLTSCISRSTVLHFERVGLSRMPRVVCKQKGSKGSKLRLASLTIREADMLFDATCLFQLESLLLSETPQIETSMTGKMVYFGMPGPSSILDDVVQN